MSLGCVLLTSVTVVLILCTVSYFFVRRVGGALMYLVGWSGFVCDGCDAMLAPTTPGSWAPLDTVQVAFSLLARFELGLLRKQPDLWTTLTQDSDCHVKLVTTGGDGCSSPAPVMLVAKAGSIYCVFRGTAAASEVSQWLNYQQTPVTGGGAIHAGFVKVYNVLRQHFLDVFAAFRKEHATATGRVIVVGHSIGCALATMAATLEQDIGCWRLLLFASPRIGDPVFADRVAQLDAHTWNNTEDPFPALPFSCMPRSLLWNTQTGPLLYRHVGKLHLFSQPPTGSVMSTHFLNAYWPTVREVSTL